MRFFRLFLSFFLGEDPLRGTAANQRGEGRERGEGLKNPCTGGIFGNKSLKGMNSLRLRLRSDSMPFLTRFIPLILSPLLHEVLSPLPLFLFGGGPFAGDCGESAGKRVVERGEGLKNPRKSGKGKK